MIWNNHTKGLLDDLYVIRWISILYSFLQINKNEQYPMALHYPLQPNNRIICYWMFYTVTGSRIIIKFKLMNEKVHFCFHFLFENKHTVHRLQWQKKTIRYVLGEFVHTVVYRQTQNHEYIEFSIEYKTTTITTILTLNWALFVGDDENVVEFFQQNSNHHQFHWKFCHGLSLSLSHTVIQ